MPCKKNQQPSSSCTPSKRRLLETMAIRDLSQTEGACAMSSNQDRHSDGPCTCDEDDCAPGTCCAKNRHCESNSRPCPRPHLCTPQTPTPTFIPICKSPEVDAMINEMKCCQEAIRTLAHEAMEMLHSEKEWPMCKQKAQEKPITIRKGSRCEYCNDSTVCLDSEGPSKPKFLAMPSPRSCPHSRSSSVPIAQQAFHIKEGRLPKTDDIENYSKKGNETENDIEKKSKKGNETDKDIEKSLKMKNKADSDMEVRSQQLNKEDSKSVLQKLFGKKTSANSSNERQIAERKKSDCACPEVKVNSQIDLLQLKPKCDKNKCQCHFPPSYNQYFTCTGQVSGNCNCDKNA